MKIFLPFLAEICGNGLIFEMRFCIMSIQKAQARKVFVQNIEREKKA